MSRTVENQARLAFLNTGLTETKNRTGVLIWISKLEHRAVILGDCGIHQKVGGSYWQAEIEKITLAIKEGRAVTGACEVISDIAKRLANEFPPEAHNSDELPPTI
jgi:putative membrane protein